MKQYIKEQKFKKMESAGYRCEYMDMNGIRCTSRATETAHRMGQGQYSRRAVYQKIKEWYNNELTEKEIDMIIWDEDNFVACCSNKAHNDSFNIHISQTEKFDKLLRKIWLKIIREYMEVWGIHVPEKNRYRNVK